MKTTVPHDPNPCRPRHFKPETCGPAAQEGPARQLLETSHTRLIITGALLCLAFVVIGARLVEVAGFKAGDVRVARSLPASHVLVGRADIVDRNGALLATTLQTPSLFANPKIVLSAREGARAAAHKLVQVLPDLDEAEVYQKLTSDKSFVWLKRRLTPRQQDAVNRLGIPGLEFQPEDKRIYPQGNAVAHVVGYAGVDNKGLAGIERSFDEPLRSSHQPVELAIDLRIQAILREETLRQMAEFKAEGGSGIIMDVNTGEVVALVSLPDFDPNDPSASPPENLFNRVTLGVYEIGSVFKIFTTAMALDAHVTSMTGGYDATNPIQIGRSCPAPVALRPRDLHVFLQHRRRQDGARCRPRSAARFPRAARAFASTPLRVARSSGAASALALAPGQHHDHRLRPRHLGQPAANRERG
jgi:cell division protein FtsI (penicillin-binding protein 3)